jgi:hypothetical protein
MRMLLVWNDKGKLTFYNIPAMDAEETLLKEINGVYFDESIYKVDPDKLKDEQKSFLKAHAAVSTSIPKGNPFPNWACKWMNHTTELPLWVAGVVDWVVHSGFKEKK